jgi:hypothetical protein
MDPRELYFDLWVSYNDNEMWISAMVFLEKLSKVHCANFILKKMSMTKDWNQTTATSIDSF